MSARATFLAIRSLSIIALATPLVAQKKPTDPLAGLDAYIQSAMKDWGVAGLGVSIVRHDSVIYAKGFGLRDVTKADKVDERTLFAIGSNSKSFTATAVGMLQDEGKLNLNDKATKYLPWFAVSDAYITNELTLRDLMTHRSGYFRGDAV